MLKYLPVTIVLCYMAYYMYVSSTTFPQYYTIKLDLQHEHDTAFGGRRIDSLMLYKDGEAYNMFDDYIVDTINHKYYYTIDDLTEGEYKGYLKTFTGNKYYIDVDITSDTMMVLDASFIHIDSPKGKLEFLSNGELKDTLELRYRITGCFVDRTKSYTVFKAGKGYGITVEDEVRFDSTSRYHFYFADNRILNAISNIEQRGEDEIKKSPEYTFMSTTTEHLFFIQGNSVKHYARSVGLDSDFITGNKGFSTTDLDSTLKAMAIKTE